VQEARGPLAMANSNGRDLILHSDSDRVAGVAKRANPPKHLRVFVSSPGDVSAERSMAFQVLGRLAWAGVVWFELFASILEESASDPAVLTSVRSVLRGAPGSSA